MFIYISKRLKKQINNTNKNKFIILKSNYLFTILFFLNAFFIKSSRAASARVSPDEIIDNKIFITLNKTLDTQIINNTYYNKIEYIMINNNQIEKAEYNNSIYKSKLELNYINIHFSSDADLTSCAYMFYNLSNIIFIDLSYFKFYFYEITNM